MPNGTYERIKKICDTLPLRGDFILQKDQLKSLIPVGNQSFKMLFDLIRVPNCLLYITTNTEKDTAGKSAGGQLALATW